MHISLTTRFFCRLILLLVIALPFCPARAAGRTVYDMNTGWAFWRGDTAGAQAPRFDDSRWTAVSLPHVMQLERKHCGGNIIYDGVGWYRRYFRLPESAQGRRVALSFEGVMTGCEVYVNGQRAATHHGGYVGFTADITRLLRPAGEDNVVAVRVKGGADSLTPPGKPQERLDFYYYSGIYRDVRLVVTDRLHLTDELEENETAGGGLFVSYPEVSRERAVVRVKAHVANRYDRPARTTVSLRLTAPGRRRAAASGSKELLLEPGAKGYVEIDLTVDHPQLWHPYHPDLYTLECEVQEGRRTTDRVSRRVGIRSIAFTASGGFSINGEPLYLVGANRHQAFPHIGDAAPNSMQERDVILLKQGGYNAVRAAHYPHDPAFLDACDRYGLLVIECIPGWQYFNSNPTFTERLERVCRQMIRRDRNHPSVILWETALNETSYPLPVVERINRAAHEEYPGPQCYTAGDYFGHEETLPYYDVFYKQVAHFPPGGDVMHNSPDNLLFLKPQLTREWGDGVGDKPRVSLAENEYEQVRQCRTRARMLCGEGYFDWSMLNANPHLGGHFMWSFNDYARGAEEQTMYSGAVDMNRLPKFSYYLMQSMRPANVSQPGLYEGPMVFVAAHNDSAALPSSSSEIWVFSNCDEVRLYRNGRLIGSQTRQEQTPAWAPTVNKGGSPCYIFNAGGYEAGTLRAEGWINGRCVARHEVSTPGRPHHIEVEPAPLGIPATADGSDLMPVYIKVCDERGTVVPSATLAVSLSVSGPATLVGDGVTRIGVNPQLTEGGTAYALVRTTGRRGRIRLTATADGLLPGSATWRSVKRQSRPLPDGHHGPFSGREDDGAVNRSTTADRQFLLTHTPIAGLQAQGPESAAAYPIRQATDGDDFTWWVAADSHLPQTVSFQLPDSATWVSAARIRFQKDSSSYQHLIETSTDGTHWEPLCRRTCTGWDFKPLKVERRIRYLRITFEKVSEGHAGLAEVTLFR